MPKSLAIECGSRTNLGMACFSHAYFNDYRAYPWFAETYPGVESPDQLRAVLAVKEPETVEIGRQAMENVKQYGVPTWYDWCYEHWGTKWNACDVELNELRQGGLCYWFDTAWSAPVPIALKLKELCQSLGLTVTWTAQDEGAHDSDELLG